MNWRLLIGPMVALLLVLSGWAAISVPQPLFLPGAVVTYDHDFDQILMVVETHCRPFSSYCTYDLAVSRYHPVLHAEAHELILGDIGIQGTRP